LEKEAIFGAKLSWLTRKTNLLLTLLQDSY